MIPEPSARQAITLAGQGPTVPEIARRLGHDRKTIRIYLNGHRAPGQPRPHADSFAPFAAYVRQRAADDPHLRSTGLHREAAALGYAGSTPRSPASCAGTASPPPAGNLQEMEARNARAGAGACPGPLPFRTAPIGGETIASYLSRTAAASHLPAGAITAVPPAMVRRPGLRLRRPRRNRPAAARDISSPGRAHRNQRNRPAARTSRPHSPAAGARPVRAALACRRCAARHG